MKIIASICEVPGLNIPGSRAIFDPSIKNVKYSLNGNIQLPHWAVSACSKIFEENTIKPEEIGIIVGTSISVTGTTEDTNSAAPGVCHTIQKELGIKNAFVFDLFHSDWCTALEIADIFLSSQTHKYGLIVKAEKFDSLNNDSGFAWPDGLSIILFKILY
jgi:3-oxoacyl-[acyl-carrier-protein] synthase III